MKIIITMAGLGSRFKKIGINKAKYEIVANDKTLFEWSLISLKNFFDYEFIFLTLKENDSKQFIKSKCLELGLTNYKIIELGKISDGQATTVLESGSSIEETDSVLIYNIDTYVDPEFLAPEMIKGDGWVPAFEAEGDRWSFIIFDENYKVLRSVEKERISEYGTIGLYYFKSFKLFKSLYTQANFQGQNEKYIAPLYDLLLKNGQVFTTILPTSSVHVLGTPEDVSKFDINYLQSNL